MNDKKKKAAAGVGFVVKPSEATRSVSRIKEKPFVDKSKCIGCGVCETNCPDNAIVVNARSRKAVVDYEHCKGCGICVVECPQKAISIKKTE